MTFQLPDLPYAKDALSPHISAETLDFHHGKHHAAYVKKVNAMLGETGASGDRALSEVIRQAKTNGEIKLFNNAAQIWNHSFFWQCLAPPNGEQPDGRLKQLIEEGFGTPEAMLAKLEEEAVNHFSNGWAWLVLNRGQLEITSLHDADTPLVHDGMVPLFTIDVWEHAYYIDYRNERPRFVSSVLKNIINWNFVADNLDGQGDHRADQEPVSARVTETA
jgi:Fe-Mn family superoxide dismutase